eukprot:scaffold7052_cov254-Pinguiococcus_pyrenoidosus.AAC.116
MIGAIDGGVDRDAAAASKGAIDGKGILGSLLGQLGDGRSAAPTEPEGECLGAWRSAGLEATASSDCRSAGRRASAQRPRRGREPHAGRRTPDLQPRSRRALCTPRGRRAGAPELLGAASRSERRPQRRPHPKAGTRTQRTSGAPFREGIGSHRGGITSVLVGGRRVAAKRGCKDGPGREPRTAFAHPGHRAGAGHPRSAVP